MEGFPERHLRTRINVPDPGSPVLGSLLLQNSESSKSKSVPGLRGERAESTRKSKPTVAWSMVCTVANPRPEHPSPKTSMSEPCSRNAQTGHTSHKQPLFQLSIGHSSANGDAAVNALLSLPSPVKQEHRQPVFHPRLPACVCCWHQMSRHRRFC